MLQHLESWWSATVVPSHNEVVARHFMRPKNDFRFGWRLETRHLCRPRVTRLRTRDFIEPVLAAAVSDDSSNLDLTYNKYFGLADHLLLQSAQ